ncbi:MULTISPECIES: hypothetical protein [unclassified Sphingomonas]|uniref:hypothetical protein n=1 Tax=unclassified Sphingomonas TaxID=196159 RepID=UPI00226ADC07|nr:MULTISPECIES: hypothetical protein [unclassified Sphingomonas]
MNAPFDTLEFAQRVKNTRLGKDGADTLARAMADVAMRDLVTQQAMEKALSGQLVKLAAINVATITIAVAVLGALLSLLK